MTTTPTTQPTATDCPAWCSYADGGHHERDRALGDLVHYGEIVTVEVSQAEPVEYDDGQFGPETWTTYLRQDAEAAAPSIWLGIGESNSGLMMTLAEAEALAERLLQLVERQRR